VFEHNSDYCALCTMFWENGCRKCPVQERVCAVGCNDTPWEDLKDVATGPVTKKTVNLHQKEIDFLESLLEDE
jgi:hypothetical protein